METIPCKPDEENYIFTEGIDYSETGKNSIWGSGDEATLELLKGMEFPGRWLNLAAGDGRYNTQILEKADHIVACDIDGSAVAKLYRNTPENLKSKLETKILDITKRLPFGDGSFDGIFCAGTLHLFPESVLRQIVSEMGRILAPRGRIIVDFAADIKRTSPDGKRVTFGKEPLYTLDSAKRLLKDIFGKYSIKMLESEVTEDFEGANPPYTLDCKFIILIADKG